MLQIEIKAKCKGKIIKLSKSSHTSAVKTQLTSTEDNFSCEEDMLNTTISKYSFLFVHLIISYNYLEDLARNIL